MRHPLLTAVAAAAAAAAFACGSAPTPSAPPAAPAGTTVRLLDFSLQPASLAVPRGTSITVVDAGKAPHNLWVRNAAGDVVARSGTLQPGQQTTLKLDLAPGDYVDFCQEPGHESLGMRGTLTIT